MPDVNGMIGTALLGTLVPIAVITIVVIVVVFILVRNLSGNSGANKALLQNGQTAQAVILSMWDTGV
ncbi:MAG TPA: hypothetical protein VGK87_08520, partial [Anaerolineae bacterium]